MPENAVVDYVAYGIGGSASQSLFSRRAAGIGNCAASCTPQRMLLPCLSSESRGVAALLTEFVGVDCQEGCQGTARRSTR